MANAKKHSYLKLFVGLSLTLSLGCSKEPECPKHWKRVVTGSQPDLLSATVTDQGLRLNSSQSLTNNLLTLKYLRPVSGDFTVTVEFDQFTQGVLGGFAQALVTQAGMNQRTGLSGVGTPPGSTSPGSYAWVQFLGNNISLSDTQTPPVTAGSFSLARNNASATATTTPPGAMAATKTDPDFGTIPAALALQVGNNAANPGSGTDTSVLIKKVRVVSDGGQTVFEDDFSCNSIED